MQMTLHQRLEEIKKRADAATLGPWQVIGTGDDGKPQYIFAKTATGCDEEDDVYYEVCRFPDASYGYACYWGENQEFIAHARTDVPRLVKVVDTLLERIESCYCESDVFPDDGTCENCKVRIQIEAILDGKV